MMLYKKIKIKGKVYDISIDPDKPDRNYSDENYMEWLITAEDGRIIEVTVWKDGNGRLRSDGTVEVYACMEDFEDDRLLDKKYVRFVHV